MTLKGHYALCFKTHATFGAHRVNLNEDRSHYQRRRCSPMTLDSGNIKFMRIFVGVRGRQGVKQQWGNRKRRFQGFRTLRPRYLRKWGHHYYIVLSSSLSPFHWPQNTMTWNSHFTFNFNFSLLRTGFYQLGFIFIVELFIEFFVVRRHQQRCAEADREKHWSAEYCGSAKGLRIIRRSFIGTLTNKANIII